MSASGYSSQISRNTRSAPRTSRGSRARAPSRRVHLETCQIHSEASLWSRPPASPLPCRPQTRSPLGASWRSRSCWPLPAALAQNAGDEQYADPFGDTARGRRRRLGGAGEPGVTGRPQATSARAAPAPAPRRRPRRPRRRPDAAGTAAVNSGQALPRIGRDSALLAGRRRRPAGLGDAAAPGRPDAPPRAPEPGRARPRPARDAALAQRTPPARASSGRSSAQVSPAETAPNTASSASVPGSSATRTASVSAPARQCRRRRAPRSAEHHQLHVRRTAGST